MKGTFRKLYLEGDPDIPNISKEDMERLRAAVFPKLTGTETKGTIMVYGTGGNMGGAGISELWENNPSMKEITPVDSMKPIFWDHGNDD